MADTGVLIWDSGQA